MSTEAKQSTNPAVQHCRIRGYAWLLRACIIEKGGSLILTGEKTGGRPNLLWFKIKRCAPECFRGPRSDQRAWRILDDVGIVVSGGTPKEGKMVATLAPKPQEEPR